MSNPPITQEQQTALLNAIAYEVKRWDWESPTLFGAEKSEFESIVQLGDHALQLKEKEFMVAGLGALREQLHGACIVTETQFQNITGISKAEGKKLLNQIEIVAKNVQ